MLKVGDKIVCIRHDINGLTYGKSYQIIDVREGSMYLGDKDVCIVDDGEYDWWFGQEGYAEPWTRWFVSEKQFLRNKKIDQIL